MANNKWTKIGALKRKSQDKPSYIVVDKSVEIIVGGQKLDLGKYRTIKLIDPVARLDKMLQSGSIDQETHQERVKQLEQYSVLYELTVPPSEE